MPPRAWGRGGTSAALSPPPISLRHNLPPSPLLTRSQSLDSSGGEDGGPPSSPRSASNRSRVDSSSPEAMQGWGYLLPSSSLMSQSSSSQQHSVSRRRFFTLLDAEPIKGPDGALVDLRAPMLFCARSEPKGSPLLGSSDGEEKKHMGKVLALHDIEVVHGEKEGGGKFSLLFKDKTRTRKVSFVDVTQSNNWLTAIRAVQRRYQTRLSHILAINPSSPIISPASTSEWSDEESNVHSPSSPSSPSSSSSNPSSSSSSVAAARPSQSVTSPVSTSPLSTSEQDERRRLTQKWQSKLISQKSLCNNLEREVAQLRAAAPPSSPALNDAKLQVEKLSAELASTKERLEKAAEVIRKGFSQSQKEKNELEQKNARLMAIVDALEAESQLHLKEAAEIVNPKSPFDKLADLTLQDIVALLADSSKREGGTTLKEDTREGRGRAARAFVKLLTTPQRRAVYAACAKSEEEDDVDIGVGIGAADVQRTPFRLVRERDSSISATKTTDDGGVSSLRQTEQQSPSDDDPMLLSLGSDMDFSDIPNSLYLGSKSISDPLSDGAHRRTGAQFTRHPHRRSDPSNDRNQSFNLPSPEAVESLLQAYSSGRAEAEQQEAANSAAESTSGGIIRSVGDLVSSSVLESINADGDVMERYEDEGHEEEGGAAAPYEAVESAQSFVPVDLTTRFGYEAIMTHFYLRHNPEKVGLINLILEDYQEDEDDLFFQMFEKYKLTADEWVAIRSSLENDLDGSKAKRFGRGGESAAVSSAPVQIPSPQKFEKAGAVRKSGWLEKKNRNGRKKMAKRFFKLVTKYEEHQTPVLLYYASDQSKKEKGTILLEGCEIADTSVPPDMNVSGTSSGPLQAKGVWTFELRHPTRETRIFKAADSVGHSSWVTLLKKVLQEFEAENSTLDKVDPQRATRRRSSLILAEAVYKQVEDEN